MVVRNYVSKWELNSVKDILVLSALRQMLCGLQMTSEGICLLNKQVDALGGVEV